MRPQPVQRPEELRIASAYRTTSGPAVLFGSLESTQALSRRHEGIYQRRGDHRFKKEKRARTYRNWREIFSWADLYYGALSDCLNYLLGTEITDGYPNMKALKEKIFALPAIKAWVDKRPPDDFDL
ncbi:hematopoietic prostaglandin D synthase-like [Homalodisca vitripennis]|uniref:hematopoietic prostaglandin D synthase-like n=1 Tax=Homalodisca vitripennis TaxID=197043 RepID=UPI001EEC5193|nr:hematopoietic prostaglandin D synthase-like [Homalodisca vitripennis]